MKPHEKNSRFLEHIASTWKIFKKFGNFTLKVSKFLETFAIFAKTFVYGRKISRHKKIQPLGRQRACNRIYAQRVYRKNNPIYWQQTRESNYRQRRSGKSYILRQIAIRLTQEGVDRRNILIMNLDLSGFGFVKTEADLAALVHTYEEHMKPKGQTFIFIDEIQNIEGWEHFVNSYSQDFTREYEFFITVPTLDCYPASLPHCYPDATSHSKYSPSHLWNMQE